MGGAALKIPPRTGDTQLIRTRGVVDDSSKKPGQAAKSITELTRQPPLVQTGMSGRFILGDTQYIITEEVLGKGSFSVVLSGFAVRRPASSEGSSDTTVLDEEGKFLQTKNTHHQNTTDGDEFIPTFSIPMDATESLSQLMEDDEEGGWSATRSMRTRQPGSSYGSLIDVVKVNQYPAATSRQEVRAVAVKTVTPTHMEKLGGSNALKREVYLVKQLATHPGVVAMEAFFQNSQSKVAYIIMEQLDGHLLSQVLKHGCCHEKDAQAIAWRLLDVVSYMHSHDISHRDLKLENILVRNQSDITSIAVTDFGLAREVRKGLRGTCGTYEYMSPQVLQYDETKKPYDAKCDVWSTGVVIFALLSGHFPFGSECKDEPGLKKSIKSGSFCFSSRAFDEVSNDAKDLISELLTVDPDNRPSASKALKHRWFESASNTWHWD